MTSFWSSIVNQFSVSSKACPNLNTKEEFVQRNFSTVLNYGEINEFGTPIFFKTMPERLFI